MRIPGANVHEQVELLNATRPRPLTQAETDRSEAIRIVAFSLRLVTEGKGTWECFRDELSIRAAMFGFDVYECLASPGGYVHIRTQRRALDGRNHQLLELSLNREQLDRLQ